jgi:hypothetical protein
MANYYNHASNQHHPSPQTPQWQQSGTNGNQTGWNAINNPYLPPQNTNTMQDTSMNQADSMNMPKLPYATARDAIRKANLSEPKKPRVPMKDIFVQIMPRDHIWELPLPEGVRNPFRGISWDYKDPDPNKPVPKPSKAVPVTHAAMPMPQAPTVDPYREQKIMEHWHGQSGANVVQAVIKAVDEVKKAEEDILINQLQMGIAVDREAAVSRVLELQVERAQKPDYRPPPNSSYQPEPKDIDTFDDP